MTASHRFSGATEQCGTVDGISLGMGTSLGLLLLGMVSLIHPEAAHSEGLPTELIQDFLVSGVSVKSYVEISTTMFSFTQHGYNPE